MKFIERTRYKLHAIAFYLQDKKDFNAVIQIEESLYQVNIQNPHFHAVPLKCRTTCTRLLTFVITMQYKQLIVYWGLEFYQLTC